MVDLSVKIGDVELANPVMPGSGTFSEVMEPVIDFNRLGAIVTKTITPDVREGNPQPRVTEYKDAMLASIGIPSKPRAATAERSRVPSPWPTFASGTHARRRSPTPASWQSNSR